MPWIKLFTMPAVCPLCVLLYLFTYLLHIRFLSSSPRPIRLLKPSCAARSVGPAPRCFSSLLTSSRPVCRLCRTACSRGESPKTCDIARMKTANTNVVSHVNRCSAILFLLPADLNALLLFQYGQSGNGDCSFERGEDREAAGAVERNVTGQNAFFYPSPTGP